VAEPFKNLINTKTVQHASTHLTKAWPEFQAKAFERAAIAGLEALEMKDRAMHIASALEMYLPQDFSNACAVIEASLAKPLAFDAEGEPINLVAKNVSAEGISGWVIWSFGEFVVRRGMNDVPRALVCLHALTQRFSAEFSIRYFIEKHPKVTLATLTQWLKDDSAHVRRLVSEGSRTRLPWGIRLHGLIENPALTLPFVLALQDDTSSYVRRSVANHLNDLAKDHTDQIADFIAAQLKNASPQRTALLKHASRNLIKLGHPKTLEAWGVGTAFKGQASAKIQPKQVRIGECVNIEVTLESSSAKAQNLVVDYAVHYVLANNKSSPKVLKGWKLSLKGQEKRTLAKKHSLKKVTTRTLYAGKHRVEVLVNGKPVNEAFFILAE
jgi:3-methyladenine DNA glycosylase AlkC